MLNPTTAFCKNGNAKLILILMLLASASSIRAQWVSTNNGLYGGKIISLTASGSNLFAATGSGVFLSTDNGTNWAAANNGLTGYSPYYITSLTSVGTNIFVATGYGVFLSTDNGTSWTPASTGLTVTVSSFAVSGSNIFAGTYLGGVFLSTDNGTSWSSVNTGLTSMAIKSIATNGSSIVAGTGAGVFLSTNNGTTWAAIDAGLTDSFNVYSLAMSGNNIFAGTQSGGVSLSTDNGTSWTAVNAGLPSTNISFLGISGTNVFSGTNGGGVYLSTNNGASWSAANNGLGYTASYAYATVKSFATIGTNTFVGTSYDGGGVFLSTDNGASWTGVNTGISSAEVHSLTVSGSNIFAATGNGAYLSTDGISWTGVNTGIPQPSDVYSIAVSGTNIFAGTYGSGVFLSTNNGTSWTGVSTGLTTPYIYSLATSGANLFAGTVGGGVFLSTDNGTNWNAVNTGLTNTTVQAIVTSGSNLFAGTQGGVFLSTDNGTSWTAMNSGLTDNIVLSLAVSGSNIYAGTNNGGVFLSTNNGASWTAVNTGLTYTHVESLAVNGSDLFAGTNGQVFLSTNNGTSWTQVNSVNGLVNTNFPSLTVSGNNVFAGTDVGVWSRPLSDFSTPTITNFTPMLGPVGLTVTITGTNFDLTPTNNIIKFNGVAATVTASTTTSITTTVPAGAITGLITVTVNGETVVSVSNFTVSPFLSNFAPAAGPVGTPVVIAGANFDANPANNIVKFNGKVATVVASTTTTITTSVPAGAAAGLITVTVSGVTAASSTSFTVTGPQWVSKNIGLGGAFVNTMVTLGGSLYAGTDVGVFLSTNSGSSWTPTNIGLDSVQVFSLAYDGTNLFAGGYGSIFRRSFNETSWTLTSAVLPYEEVTSIAISGSNVFAGTQFHGMYLSPDNGLSWSAINTGLTTLEINSIAISGSNIFVGTGGGGVFLSTNNGSNWAAVNAGLTNSNVNSITTFSTSIYIGTDAGVFLSVNNGTSWTAINTGLNTPVQSINIYASGQIFAGTIGNGVFRSIDNGSSWTPVNTGLPSPTILSVASVGGTKIFAGTTVGVFSITQGGNAWTSANDGLTGWGTRSVVASGTNLITGTEEGGAFFSTDNGVGWTPVSGMPTTNPINCFVNSGSNLFAGTGNGVYVSADNGQSWTASGTVGNSIVTLLANGGYIFAGSHDPAGVFVSSDNGTSWIPASSGLPNNPVQSLAVIGSNLFAAVYGGGVFLSTNNGANWSAVNAGLTNTNVYSLLALGSNLYAGTVGGGVFFSTDNGISWTSLNTGLTNLNVSNLAGNGNNIFAATYYSGGGVFYSSNAGASWRLANEGLTGTDVTTLTINGNEILAGLNDGGVWSRPLTDFTGPSISSFTPPSGLAGTSVTILGLNFDPIPNKNTVSFNGTPAVVTASTTTSITTSVPSGATTGSISVTVGANTVQSVGNFLVATGQPPLNLVHASSLLDNGLALAIAVQGNYAYVASYAAGGSLEIIDASNPLAPVHKGTIVDDTTHGVFLFQPYGIFVKGNYAYVVGQSATMEIVDISNPSLPTHVGNFVAGPISYIIRKVFVVGNYAYLIGGAPSLQIVDISNPTSPVLVGGLGAPASRSIFISGSYAYLTCTNNTFSVVDVSNPAAPFIAGSLLDGAGGAMLKFPYSVVVSGNYAYVASSSSNALEIIDVSNPTAPVHASSLANGSGGAVFSSPLNIRKSGNFVFLANSAGNGSIEVVYVGDPTAPVHAGSLSNGQGGAIISDSWALDVSGNFAFVANGGSSYLEIVSLFSPADFAATSATSIAPASFHANWAASTYTMNYFLDVSTDNFATFVGSYDARDVGNVTSFNVSSLTPGIAYQYRLRANNLSGASNYSNTISLSTLQITDSLALVALYNSLNGSNWINKTNWLTGSLNSWYGVTIQNTHVVALKLPSNGLSGIIPVEVGNFSHLKILDLSGNSISGTLPPELLNLSTITQLILNNNKLISIPNLTTIPSLDSLLVQNNNLAFGDLEPNITLPVFIYSPQDSVDLAESILKQISDTQTFNAVLTGSANAYQWQKNGTPISGQNNTSLAISNITFKDDATYTYAATNSIVSGLTLYSHKKILRVSSLQRDSIALRALYFDTNGAGWTNSTNWLTTPLGTGNWFGITISGNRVSAVNLPNNNLRDSVPQVVADVLQLTSLNLSNNKIQHIPNLTALAALGTLDVSNNALDFASLISNVGITGINYANQANLGTTVDSLVTYGTNYPLVVTTRGQGNQYQWARNGSSVAGAVDSIYQITAINRNNMGTYICVVTNPAVPSLTLTTNPQRARAVATLSGKFVLPDSTKINNANIILFKINPVGAYDTTFIKPILADGSFVLTKVVLDDYVLLGNPDTTAFPTALPTYYTSKAFWELADTLNVQSNRPGLDIVAVIKPAPPKGNGSISGTFFDDNGTSGGRVKARRRVSGAGVCATRAEGSGRTQAKNYILVARTVTDKDGLFEIDHLLTGGYRLNIQYPGYPMDTTSFIDFTIGSNPSDKQVAIEAVVQNNKIHVQILTITGLEPDDSRFSIYPNPTRLMLNIDLNEPMTDVEFAVSTTTGQKMIAGKLNESGPNRINVSALSAGIYLVELMQQGRLIKTFRIVLE